MNKNTDWIKHNKIKKKQKKKMKKLKNFFFLKKKKKKKILNNICNNQISYGSIHLKFLSFF